MEKLAFDTLRKINDHYGLNSENKVIDLSTMLPTGELGTEDVINRIRGMTGGSSGLASLATKLLNTKMSNGLGSSVGSSLGSLFNALNK